MKTVPVQGAMMNEKKYYSRITCYLVFLLLVSFLVSCQKAAIHKPPSSNGDFQIHLISLSRIVDAVQADEELDILNNPQYIISDDQIERYDWSQQIITFNNSVQDMYVNDTNFLSWPSNFAIVWNGMIVTEGDIMDTVSPLRVTYPVIYVLEPRGDPQFPISSYKTIGNIAPNPSSIKDLSILLIADSTKSIAEVDERDLVFDDSVVIEIKEHFRQDGRLID